VATRNLILLLAILTVACRESLSPAQYVGRYPLRTVNAAPIPGSAPGTPTGCTVGFQSGSLALAEGVFSLDAAPVYCCQGVCVINGWSSMGGAVTGSGDYLSLRAIDPTNGATIEAGLSVSGSDVVLSFPAGALGFGARTTLVFGPKQQ